VEGFVLMTSQLSPFSLKIQSCLAFTGHRYQCLPGQGGKTKNTVKAIKVEIAKRRGTIYKYPQMTALDEYPGVPYLIEPSGRVQYDSSAIANWLDTQKNPHEDRKLLPTEPTLAFVVQLIDEAMDDFALNIAHHMRWLHSAQSNDAGERLFKEFSGFAFFSLLKDFPRGFSKRQVRRLPYLLSMPASDYKQDVPAYLKAPIKENWPPTHELLDHCWSEYILALEAVLSKQSYLLGEQFTLADASVFGMFGILLDDPAAEQDMLKRTPVLHGWLNKIKNNQHLSDISTAELTLSPALKPLLNIILKTFVPFMKQNKAAYELHKARGETLFNEAGLRENRALYTSELLAHPYKAVSKTFTVQVWQDLVKTWQALPPPCEQELKSYLSEFNYFCDEQNTQVCVDFLDDPLSAVAI